MTLNMTNEQYDPQLGNRESVLFQKLSSELVSSMEPLFFSTPGMQVITVVKFTPHPTGVMATVDLGSLKYDDAPILREIVKEELNNRRIGSHAVSPEGFTFRKIEDGSTSCPTDQLRCPSGECILESDYCNGVKDCKDGWDEAVCDSPPCAPFHFFCDDRCLPDSARCDSYVDCADESDEFGCEEQACRDDQFHCRNGSCIEFHQRCDLKVDCENGEDESFCPPCEDNEFRCFDGACIALAKYCDSRYDCPDLSDEYSCRRSPSPAPPPPAPTCDLDQWQCDDGSCIAKQYRCNGHVECHRDNSDERDCPSPACHPTTEFRCGDGTCIDARRKCDRHPDCSDRSDERDCPECSSNQFMCSDRTCILNDLACNGHPDCPDGSDERDCQRPDPRRCSDGQFQCTDGTCIDAHDRCNEYPQCPDRSDERNCAECAPGYVSCHDGTCVDVRRRCDGRQDCADGSDEHCVCLPGQFQCNDRTCVDPHLQCDGKHDCYDGSDEENCVPTVAPSPAPACLPDDFVCGDRTCVPRSKVCDGRVDCIDNSDEAACVCGASQFTCRNGQCIDERRKCDDRFDCSDRSDEDNCPAAGCQAHEFRCGDGRCIDQRRTCDNYPDCADHSDESHCPGAGCSDGQFQCHNGECVSRTARCNGRRECRDGSDERDCPQGPQDRCQLTEFTCDNGECIESSFQCDGKTDCSDYSDELSCPPRGNINLKIYPDTQVIHQSREVVFQCRDEGTQRAPVRWSRQGNRPLPPGSSDVVGRLTMPNIQPEHAGQYLCTAIGFPATQLGVQRSVHLQVEPYVAPTTPLPKTGACTSAESTCHNGQCIKKEFVCDDDLDCQDGSDEQNCARDQVCEPNEFRCNNSKCILKFWLCDGDNDCLDRSDEVGCVAPPSGSECRYDEYQCRSGKQCIPKSFLCDGEMDCQDQSDEIGCAPPTIVNLPPEIVTVTAGESVTLTCRALGTPTPLINWRLNWGNVPPPPRVTVTSENGRGELIIRNVQPSDQGAYTCEAISQKESILGRPDTQLIVRTLTPVPICRPPVFNSAARSRDECVNCFCFGATDQCTSSSLYTAQLPPIAESSISAVTFGPDGSYRLQDPRFTIDQENVDFRPANREFRIDSRIRRGNPQSVRYYWTMPIQLQGDKLSSYGGYIRYSIMYRIVSSSPKPLSGADILIKGNGVTLSYTNNSRIAPGTKNDIAARFWEGNWVRLSSPEQPHRPGSSLPASREDIMMVLQNIDIFLVRAGYDENFAETSLIGLTMDTAVPQETGQPRASFVEECTCPPGYTGMSCQSCAPGYSRVSTGRHLGECRRSVCNCNGHSDSCSSQGVCERCQHHTEGAQCERCQSGFYGDARRGTPVDCQPCPCPLTSPPNQFSSTCYLDRDGQVTCDNCADGHEGRRCERCAPGHRGDPLIPGDSCRRDPTDQCDALGSTSLSPNPVTGLCQCKAFVTGPKCNQCQSSTYHLNTHSPGGCIPCFCMGITRDCSSCQKFRSSEKVQFSDSPQGFTLTTVDRIQDIDRGLQVDRANRRLKYADFYYVSRGRTYYWNLPQQFVGDKITSYGGYFNYTVEFKSSPGATPNTDPDVQITGNGITFDYYHRYQFVPDAPNTVSIPMFEQYWKRTDGQAASREHLLMALADLNSIMIKATYLSDMIETSISEVVMEIAEDRHTGGRQAVEVEQCRCPIGYKGLSCEDCDAGYTRSGGGLYLGLCEPCFCNGHSSDCDPETGECKNCQHNTEGEYCEICKRGYKGDATRGTVYDCQIGLEEPCRCSIQGSLGLECDARNQCPCKKNVEGQNCNRCKEGSFHLEARKPEGCTRCFCFGITEQCTSSSYYVSEIALQITDARGHGVTVMNSKQNRSTGGSVTGNAVQNEVMFRSFSHGSDDVETLYWSLPQQFLGNRLTSYGGTLSFMQRYLSRGEGESYDDADIMIIGNGVTMQHVIRPALQPDEGRNNRVKLIESDWQQADARGLSPASRENFLMALANVEAILIRATFNTRMVDSVLGRVVLDSAVPYSTGKDLALAIEQCSCPPGYTGLSCEECAPGFNRDTSAGPFLGHCTICNCHGHSKNCEPNTGECLFCEHNTAGTSCQKCAQGFYGDATRGRSDDCKPCPCPLTAPSNQFSPTCFLDNDGQPTCSACPAGYVGRNCESCAPGFQGNPRQAGDSCRQNGGPTVSVRIDEPKVVRSSVGSTVSFRCSGSSQVSYNIVWTKQGDSLPSQAQERDGLLIIPHIRFQDAGVYVCTGSDLYSEYQDYATLHVARDPAPSPTTRPRVWIEPSYLDLNVGESAEFQCRSDGHPSPSLQWTRKDKVLSTSASVYDGLLRIRAVRKSDEGEYYCTATNEAGSDDSRIILYVRGDDRPEPPSDPRVTITPQSHSARLGETVQFECHSSYLLSVNPHYTWSRSNHALPAAAAPVGNILTLPNVDESFDGTYVCTVTTTVGSNQAQTRLEIVKSGRPGIRPTCTIEPEQQTVSQGSTVELRCSTQGEPTPRVVWSKVSEELGSHHQVIGTTLRINNAHVSDRGVYVCLAENSEGTAQASTVLEVERREPPGIEIFPKTSQTISRGGNAIFQCRTTAGYPTPTITWTRIDGRPLTRSAEIMSGGSVIRFNRVVGDEAGQYVCTAENDAGLVTATVSLVIEGLPVVKMFPSSPYTISVGQRAYIECKAEGDPTPNVSWQRLRHTDSDRSALPRESSGYAILEINNVRREDGGIYICSARNSAGSSEDRFELIVDGSAISTPPIGTTQGDILVPEGSRAEISCYVIDSQTSDITLQWMRSDGKPMPAGHTVREGQLVIENARKEDAGEYSCLGMKNGVIVFTANERLHVIAPPKITLTPIQQTARPGDPVYIRCSAVGDQPIDIEWTRIGGVLGHTAITSRGDLQFRSISISDAGRYLCTARNNAGKAEGVADVLVNEGNVLSGGCGQQICEGGACQQADPECTQTLLNCEAGGYPCTEEPVISIPNKDVNVYLGSTVDLSCEVRGTPLPTVRWTKEGGDLPINSRLIDTNLRINSVRIEDAGRYYCTASNDAGSTRDYLLLHVKGLTAVAVHIRPSLDVVRIGDNVDVVCEVSGDSSALISWSRNGAALPHNAQTAGNLLRLKNILPENGGTYRCQVETHTGTFTEDYILAIQDIPSLPQNRQVETRTAPFGSTISMDCRSTLHPPVEYTWTKQGGLLPADATVRGATLTIPDVRAEDAGTYVCSVRDAEDSIDVPTILLVTGVVPYFAQAPSSFMALATLPDVYLELDIEVSFKPENSDGLLLYNGQESGGRGDFVSFGLSRGYAEFRFDLGSGPAIIRSDSPLEMNQWHTVHLKRDKKTGTLIVDGFPPVNDTSAGRHQGLDLVEPLYVGGVPDFGNIHRQSGFETGFVGCISRLIISNVPQQLVRDAQVTSGVTSCETCAVNPCINGGWCQEAHTVVGHVCICPPGFSGHVCEKIGEACYPGVCGTGRCINRQEGGFDCYCPFGKAGLRCENDIIIHEPAFQDDSFIAYPTPNARAQRLLQVNTRFKPRDVKDGIVLYCGQNPEGHGDFIAITIKDSHVEMRFDTGSGPAVLQSREKLQADQWVQVFAERNVRDGTLVIDNGEPVRGKSPGFTRGLDLRLPLYVGGVDKHKVTVSPLVEVSEGFDGCISDIKVSGVEIDLINSVIDAANVKDCGGHSPCDRHPCLNGALCRELGPKPSEYECICEEGFRGQNCEIEEDICKVIRPCRNGICIGTGNSYRCNCPLGFKGDYCETASEFGENVRFDGNGFLELPHGLLPHSAVNVDEMITINFQTSEPDGLILWHGQPPDVEGKGLDFFALAVVDGHLEFSYELGSGPAEIRSPIRVDDGNKHKVILKRSGRDGSLELDNVFTEMGMSDGILQMLNAGGNIYIGGTPDLDTMTAGRYQHGFNGCILDLEIQDTGTLDLQHTAVSGVNARGCDDDDDINTSSEHLDNQIHQ